MNNESLQLTVIEKDQKYCNKCRMFKPLTDFGTTQKRYQCKECYSKWKKEYYQRPHVKEKEYKHLMRRFFKKEYGITLEQYQEMLLKQNGKCKLCLKEQDFKDYRSARRINLSVDHCHTTGKVRGLLCIKCNQGLGAFNDDIELIKKAMEYILSNK